MHIDPTIRGISIVAPPTPDTADPSLVVLVEDDKDLRRVLCKLLVEKWGYTVIVSDRPEHSWRFMRSCQHPIACVIAEARFATYTVMDCLQFAERVRAQSPQLPIIVLAGPIDTGVTRALAPLHVRIVHKPFQIADLLDALPCKEAPQS